MSTDAISKLPAATRSLIETTFANGQTTAADTDVVSVSEWLDKISSGDLVKENALKPLDEILTSKTYLVGSQPTAADVALYATLHHVIDALSKQPPSSFYGIPSVTRYFDHIQNLPNVRTSTNAPPVIPLESVIEAAPKLERKAPEPVKKKGKKEGDAAASPAPEASAVGTTSQAIPASASTPSTGKEKKEKKEKPKKEAGAGAGGESSGKKGSGTATPSVQEDAGPPSPAMIDLRVGHIVDVKRHPDADGLYVEASTPQIDIGEETGPRTIISGLVNYVPIEKMQDKYLVVVANLKPANMRGIKSYGMVLCATSKEGKEAGIEVIDPPAGSKPGDRVYFEGDQYAEVQPLSQLNPKKKVFETIQPGFVTLDSKEAAWINPETKSVHRIVTKLGPCTAPTLVGASLS
ncbi:G4 quadruplex nucleic acid binding protein [Tulasnella sp. 403]|nr:G4 quadruplex nucleic acid binding protein [Tulasnella sp. 403]